MRGDLLNSCFRFARRPAVFVAGSISSKLNAQTLRAWLLIPLLFLPAFPATTAAQAKFQLGPGYVREISATMPDVLQALNELLEDQTIHGTLVYDKQPTLTGALIVESTPVFPKWEGPEKVFYKIRPDAIAPRHFEESRDQGTIAVRYIITRVNANRTRVRIDALYQEKTHKTLHISDGSVEAAEYKVFEDLLNSIQFAEQEASDAKRRRASADLVRETRLRQHDDESTRLAAAQSSVEELKKNVGELRHDLDRRVKAPGADLKAAPFRSAQNLQQLSAYTEVVIVIVTPHWVGVQTPEGQRGWLPLDELEPLP